MQKNVATDLDQISDITITKAAEAALHHYRVTGLILTHPDTGARCLIDQDRVIWLELDEMRELGKPRIKNIKCESNKAGIVRARRI